MNIKKDPWILKKPTLEQRFKIVILLKAAGFDVSENIEDYEEEFDKSWPDIGWERDKQNDDTVFVTNIIGKPGFRFLGRRRIKPKVIKLHILEQKLVACIKRRKCK